MKTNHRFVAFAFSLLAFYCPVCLGAAGMDQMLARLPDGTNVIMAADVGYLRESPAIGRLRWAARGASTSPLAILPSLPGVKNVCIGAQFNLDTLRPNWQLALLQVDTMPPLQQIAQGARGYVDNINGLQAAWSPAGACFIGLDPNTLASAQPGNRQMISRWVRTRGASSNAATLAYLRSAAAQVSDQTPIVFAIDLQDAFTVPAVVGWLRGSSDDAVAGAAPDKSAAAKVLATARGVTIRVAVAETCTAVASVDFGGDTTPLGQLAKPLFLQILADRGLTLPGVESWTFAPAGGTITCQGTLSDQALRQLLSLLQSPSPEMPAAAKAAAQPGQGTAPPPAAGQAAMGAASAKYFNSIGVMLDNIRPGSSLGEQAGWLSRYASRIDQLPAANVDPELLSWGASVSANLRAASSILEAGQQRVTAAAQSGQAPVGSYSTTIYDSGDDQRDAQYRADLENYRRQNRQASQNIRSQVTTEANKPIQAAIDSRGRIRATMVERYGENFK